MGVPAAQLGIDFTGEYNCEITLENRANWRDKWCGTQKAELKADAEETLVTYGIINSVYRWENRAQHNRFRQPGSESDYFYQSEMCEQLKARIGIRRVRRQTVLR